jgi:hypothetical protein
MKDFAKLAGSWELSGGITGRVHHEWLPGGYFLRGRSELVQHGRPIRAVEIIGHSRMWRGAPSRDVLSRAYDSEGNTLDYVYELIGDDLRIWAGERGSDTYYEGRFTAGATELIGFWHYPGNSGYESHAVRIGDSRS